MVYLVQGVTGARGDASELDLRVTPRTIILAFVLGLLVIVVLFLFFRRLG